MRLHGSYPATPKVWREDRRSVSWPNGLLTFLYVRWHFTDYKNDEKNLESSELNSHEVTQRLRVDTHADCCHFYRVQ